MYRRAIITLTDKVKTKTSLIPTTSANIECNDAASLAGESPSVPTSDVANNCNTSMTNVINNGSPIGILWLDRILDPDPVLLVVLARFHRPQMGWVVVQMGG